MATAHPSLFVYIKAPVTSESDHDRSEILEVQAVDPPACRSWFMDDDRVLEGCFQRVETRNISNPVW